MVEREDQGDQIFFVPVERGKYHQLVSDSYEITGARIEIKRLQAALSAALRPEQDDAAAMLAAFDAVMSDGYDPGNAALITFELAWKAGRDYSAAQRQEGAGEVERCPEFCAVCWHRRNREALAQPARGEEKD